MMHELFHRIQPLIALSPPDASSPHLDMLEGRIWIQLEWRALRAALDRAGPQRRAAIEDALVFRAARRTFFPDAATTEAALELAEGLAEYTGLRLDGTSVGETRRLVATRLGTAHDRLSFARSFAAETGPAYGLLLDEAQPGWRRELGAGDDLAWRLREAIGWSLPADPLPVAAERALRYDGARLRAGEIERERDRQQRTAQARTLLVEGPVLVLPLDASSSYALDATAALPLGDAGVYYPALRASAGWGILEAASGVLVNLQAGYLRVSAPSDLQARPVKGHGWILTLTDGWRIVAGTRDGDFQVAPSGGEECAETAL
jgi:hypothetical protein